MIAMTTSLNNRKTQDQGTQKETPKNTPKNTPGTVAECSLVNAKKSARPSLKKTRVAVCMSGGVDSSTTALLLQQAGFDVIGVTGWLIKSGSRCCDTGMIDAAKVCQQLDISHHAVDLRELFKHEVMDNFHESY